MSNEEALALIIKKYCVVHNISYSEFARETGVSRAYINRIISNKCGKFGISSTIKELIAKGYVVKPGRHLHFCECEIYCDDKLVSKSSGTFCVVHPQI